MKTIILAILISTITLANPLVITRPHIMMDATRAAELASFADSGDPAVSANYETFIAALDPFHPYVDDTYDAVNRASEFALLYVINKQPFGGTRASYADLAKDYALDYIRARYSSMNCAITAITASATPEITLDCNHGVTASTTREVIVAGGMGTWSPYAMDAVTFTAHATDPTKGTLSSCSAEYTYLAPCSLDTTSLGSITGQNISVFFGGPTSGDPTVFTLDFIHGSNQVRGFLRRFAITYDFIEPGVTKDADWYHLRNFLMHQAAMWQVRNAVAGTDTAGCSVITVGSNLCAGNLTGPIFAAAALGSDWEESGSTLDAQMLFDLGRDRWVELFGSGTIDEFSTPAGYLSGGWSYEGAEYAPQTFIIHLEIAEVIGTASGESMTDLIGTWDAKVVDAVLHYTSTLPSKSPLPASPSGTNRYEPVPFADIQDNYLHRYSVEWVKLGVVLQYYAMRAARTTDAEKIAYWMTNMSGTADTGLNAAYANFFWQTAQVSSVDHRASLPLQRRDVGLNIVSARDSFTSGNATWTWVLAAPVKGNHSHGAPGDFGINRKGYMLTREWTGWGTQPAHGTVHNIPYYGLLAAGTRSTVVADPSMTHYDASDSAYVYARIQMQNPYRCPESGTGSSGCIPTQRVNTATRYWLYIRPSLVIVGDTVNYLSSLPSRYLLHFRQQPTVVGNTITYVEGDQKLTANVIFPASMGSVVRDSSKGYVMYAESSSTSTFLWQDYYENTTGTKTYTGATGDWMGLNSGVSVTANGSNSGIHRFQRAVAALNSSAFAAFGTQNVVRSTSQFTRNPSAYGTDWRVEYFHNNSGVPTNRTNDNSLIALEAHDDSATATTQTPISVSVGNWHGVQAASYNIVVIAPNNETVAVPITYTFDDTTSPVHLVVGLTPSTQYNVDTSTPDQIAITTCSGCASPISTNTAGVLQIGQFSAPSSDNSIGASGKTDVAGATSVP